MNNDEFLKIIATTAYNVGFGAKKHFATYDIVSKAPGAISFFSMAFGIYALAFDALSVKFLSASFIVLGIIGLYISFYDSKKDEYENAGIELTQLFNKLHRLYRQSKNADQETLAQYEQELSEIETSYYDKAISKQIMFSDWYAHHKFFWQQQIEWIDEQKHFKFLRDKVPLSLIATVVIISFIILGCWSGLFHKFYFLIKNCI